MEKESTPSRESSVTQASVLRRRPVWMWALAVIPSLSYVLSWPRFGMLQSNDYYPIMGQILGTVTQPWNPLQWSAIRSNEHLCAIPSFLYWLNFELCAGDNRGLSLIVLLGLYGVLGFLLVLSQRSRPDHPASEAVLVLGIAAVVFTPAMAHSVVMGFSGTQWILSDFLVVGTMALAISLWDREKPVYGMVPVILVGWIGTLTYSTNLPLWPALIVGALVFGGRLKDLLPLTGAGIVAAAFLSHYSSRPGHHPDPLLDPLALARFVATYLGSALRRDTPTAELAGWIGYALVAGGIAIVVFSRNTRLRRSAAPWIMLVVFSLGNALGTAVSRGGWGIEAAKQSRYVTISCLFWVAVLGLAAAGSAKLVSKRGRSWSLIFLLVAAPAIAGLTWTRGKPVLKFFLDRSSWHPVAAIALQYRLEDDEAIRSFFPFPDQFYSIWKAVDTMEEIGHVPFNRLPPKAYGRQIHPPDGNEPGSGLVGRLSSVEPIHGSIHLVKGWADSPPESGRLLFVDEAGVVRGEAALPLPFGSRLPTPSVRREKIVGWAGYAMVEPGSAPLTAYFEKSDQDSTIRVDGVRVELQTVDGD